MSDTIGISFSHSHLESLQLEPMEAMAQACSFGFSHIRLGSYWPINQPSATKFDFSQLKQTLTICEQHSQSVVLTVGVKAPRWPEFYWPAFISDHNLTHEPIQNAVLNYVYELIHQVQDFSCITHWQIENEPLDPSGPTKAVVPASLLRREAELVKHLDHRPLIMNVWGNEVLQRKVVAQLFPLADVVGLDMYYKVFRTQLMGKSIYTAPQTTDHQLKTFIARSPKPIWLTELQAEPWEANESEYLKVETPSMSPSILHSLLRRVQQLGFKETLLWGFEYWLYQSLHGDDRYFDVVRTAMNPHTSTFSA